MEQNRDGTHVSEILHVPHKVSLRVDHLIDSFLSLLLSIRHAIDYFLWHGVYPQCPRFLQRQKV